jgi:hypothetical protein
MLLIIIVIVYVPMLTSRVSEIYNSTSPFQRAKYTATSSKAHVILSGTISYSAIVDFCREFFAADSSSHVVVLGQMDPNLEMRRLLRHPFYRNRVHFLTGSALSIPDLRRAAASHATGLFLVNLPNDGSKNGGGDSAVEDEQIKVTRGADAEILMQALVSKKSFPGLQILAQVQDIRSEDLSQHCGCDRVLCLDSIKMSILSRDCLVPGFLALVLNLVSTYKEGVVQASQEDAQNDDAFWMQEYSSGASNQVFSFRIPPGLVRTKWAEVVEVIYRAFGVTLFAVLSSSGRHANKIRLNPGKDYNLKDDDVVFCMANAGDEIILRICIQFKDPIPRAHLEIMELEAEMDAKLPSKPTGPQGSLDALSSNFDLSDGSKSNNQNSNGFLNADWGTPYGTSMGSVMMQRRDLAKIPVTALENHIILCGRTTARGIRHFVSGIRIAESKYNDYKGTYGGIPHQQRIPIICLLENIPEEVLNDGTETGGRAAGAMGDGGIWADILKDEDVHLMKGTPLKKTSLIRCGVERCKRIVIFSSSANGVGGVDGNSNAEQSHVLMDANAIFIIKMIQEVSFTLSFFLLRIPKVYIII